MCALSMEEVHGIGVKEAVKYALSRIDPRNKRQVHVSFDIDALDPLEAPSTGTPGNIPLIQLILELRLIEFYISSSWRTYSSRGNRAS